MRYEPAFYYRPEGVRPGSAEFTRVLGSSRAWAGAKNVVIEEMQDNGGSVRNTFATGYRLAMLLNEGTETWWRDGAIGRWRRGNPGTISVAPPGPSLTSSWRGVRRFLLVSVKPEFVASVAGEETRRRLDAMPMHYCLDEYYPDAARGQQLLQALLGLVRQPTPADPLTVEAISIALVGWMSELAGVPPAIEPADGLCRAYTRRVAEFIDANLAVPFTLLDLARLVDVSPFHFSRQFKRSIGVPPWQYVMRCRVDRAAEMLIARPECDLASVALAFGFTDQSHLNRVFRQFLGVTPGAFSRRHREGSPAGRV